MDAKSRNDESKDAKAKFVKAESAKQESLNSKSTAKTMFAESSGKSNAKSKFAKPTSAKPISAKLMSAKQKRERNKKVLTGVRFVVQVIFFLLLPGLFSAGSIDNIAVAAFVILGLLALGMMVRERFFCQFFCPLGAIFSLMPVVGPLGVTRNPEKCPPNCGQCIKHCPVSIWPDPDGLCAGECISCGRCVTVCPLNNISVCSYGKKRQVEAAYELAYTPRRKARSEMGTLFAPAALTGILVLATVNTHEPLVFDAETYQPPNPDVSQLQLLELPASKSGVATLEITLPEKAKAARLRNGIYIGEALCGEGNDEDWKPYYLLVEVEVKDGRIAGITNMYGDATSTVDPNYWYDSVENGIYLKRAIEGTGGRFTKGALEQITTFLESGEETGGIDTVSGSTYSVVSIVQACNRAVADAVSAS